MGWPELLVKGLKRIPGVSAIRSLISEARLALTDKEAHNQQLQRIIVNQYRTFLSSDQKPYDRIADAGFRCYSQFEEDGIILYIFSMIGTYNKTVVEISCGDGRECMATNLVLNHGFMGYLFDASPKNVAKAVRFFKHKKDCLLYPPRLKAAWITRENVNHLLREIGASGEVDLLSLDIDGNDYYIWEAISAIRPRLCVFETHDIIPDDLSLTIRYDPNFNCWQKSGFETDYRSVSLLAMKRLSERKGYRLIGSNRHGFNVFFLRNDLAIEIFPEVSISDIHDNFWTRSGQSERWPRVREMNWVAV